MIVEVVERYRGRKFPPVLKRAIAKALDRPLKRIESRQSDDWYRGHRRIAWNTETAKGKHYFEIFATSCFNCGQWFGWTPDLKKVLRLRNKMKKLKACPVCKGRKKSRGRTARKSRS